jgi:hypothetical protein
MILNVTAKPREYFTCMRRIALKGEPLECKHVTTIEEFERVFEKCKNVKAVIVDQDNFMLANDILNYVACPVLTLNVEMVGDITNCKFIEYE